jgi:raffinose/stachyose/melibiose transport system substrate-binding protein
MYVRYADEESQVPYDYAVDALADEYPDVTIDRIEQGPDPGQQLRTFAATGNLPDIFDARLDVISVFIESDNILQLDDYAEEFGFVDKVLPSARNTLYHTDGHIWAFPFVGNEFFLLYYNKALFEEHGAPVPSTYTELQEAIEIFNENDVIPMSLFAGQKWPTVSFYDAFVTRLEPSGIVALDRGEAMASDPPYQRAAEAIHGLVEQDLFPSGVTTLNYEQARALFYDGRAAVNDITAIRVIHQLMRAGTRIPDDLSVIGYDRLPASDALPFALSGVDLCIDELYAHAAEALIDILADKAAGRASGPIDIRVPPRLVPGDSVRRLL